MININKIHIAIAVIAGVILGVSFLSFSSVHADEDCGTATYEFYHDGSNSRVDIHTHHNGTEEIDASGKNGWSITDIQLDQDGGSKSYIKDIGSGNKNDYDPSDFGDIGWVKVSVSKTCPTQSPTASPVVTPSPTPVTTASPTPTVTPQPSEEPVNNDVPLSSAGFVGVCDGQTNPVIPWSYSDRNETDATIHFVPTADINAHVNVVFSENPFEIIFNLGSHGLRDWTPDNGVVVLHDLVKNRPYFYRVQNGCSPWSAIYFIR